MVCKEWLGVRANHKPAMIIRLHSDGKAAWPVAAILEPECAVGDQDRLQSDDTDGDQR